MILTLWKRTTVSATRRPFGRSKLSMWWPHVYPGIKEDEAACSSCWRLLQFVSDTGRYGRRESGERISTLAEPGDGTGTCTDGGEIYDFLLAPTNGGRVNAAFEIGQIKTFFSAGAVIIMGCLSTRCTMGHKMIIIEAWKISPGKRAGLHRHPLCYCGCHARLFYRTVIVVTQEVDDIISHRLS